MPYPLLISANQITWSRLLIQIHILDGKQCRSRSFGSQLIWIYTVCKGRVYPVSAGPGFRRINRYGQRKLIIRCSSPTAPKNSDQIKNFEDAELFRDNWTFAENRFYTTFKNCKWIILMKRVLKQGFLLFVHDSVSYLVLLDWHLNSLYGPGIKNKIHTSTPFFFS